MFPLLPTSSFTRTRLGYVSPEIGNKHLQKPQWADETLQERRGNTNTHANNARFYRDSKGPTLHTVEPAERERLISAAWKFEFMAKVTRQVGHYDHERNGVYMPPNDIADRKAEQLFDRTCCQLERVACIYNYVRGLYRQIFYCLGQEFLSHVRRQQSMYDSGMLYVDVEEDSEPISFPMLLIRYEYDDTLVPKIFKYSDRQDEYIDLLCTFGFEFLKHVLEMDPEDRQEMIVRTFYPGRPTANANPIFRELLEAAQVEYTQNRRIVIGEGTWSDTPAMASFQENMAWVRYSVTPHPDDPNDWSRARVRRDHDITHNCEFPLAQNDTS